ADAAAAHLGPAPVGVAELHGEVGPVPPGRDPDDAVGADARVAIGDAPDELDVEGLTRGAVDDDQEVVAQGLVLLHGHRFQSPRTTGKRSRGSPAVANQVMRGSRRNHMRWRRDNSRVRRAATSSASSSEQRPAVWSRSSLYPRA